VDHSRIETLYERIGGRESVATLLRHFYADVRQHRLIGPIFNAQISDWREHLELIGSFWTRLTGGPSNYSGNVPGKHILLGLSPNHFQTWLQLWEFNCRNYLKTPEAAEMIELAHDIGRRLSRLAGAGTTAP
jgi:hemoglobin